MDSQKSGRKKIIGEKLKKRTLPWARSKTSMILIVIILTIFWWKNVAKDDKKVIFSDTLDV